jgi:hypothetical protein
MRTDRGSAVAIVMLVLAVVSLIGVALLTQSRLDMQLTTSLQVYDDMSSRADAVATDQLARLRGCYRYDTPTCCGPSDPTTPDFLYIDKTLLPAPADPSSPSITSANSASKKDMVGYSINPPAGFQRGSAPTGYSEVYYVVKGRAWNPYAYRVVKTGGIYDVPETTITVAVSIIRKNSP